MNPYGDSYPEKMPVPDGRLAVPMTTLDKPAITYTISARGKSPDVPIYAFLRRQYGNIPLGEIESLFQ